MQSFGRWAVSWLVVGAALSAAFADALPLLDGQGLGPLLWLSPVQPVPPPSLDDGRSPVGPRWRSRFESFAAADREHLPGAGGIVVVGSSSIGLWGDLEAQFPSKNLVRRGIGGARMADLARHADRLILPYRPRLVVVYAGDNDLAEGVQPEQVLAAYADLVGQVRRALPAARIAFVSIKPSPARAALRVKIARTNALVAAYSADDPSLDYIDVHSRMLDAAGQARPELFGPDALHLSAAGYAVWRTALAAHLP